MTVEAPDMVCALLAREFVTSVSERGVRVLAITSPVSMVAGLLAQRSGAPTLALAGGFGRLDVTPRPAVLSGEFALGMETSPLSMSSETFMALAQGRIGVVVSPAQIDANAALNLSAIGWERGRPAVALVGSRGLPDNNHSPSTVWYFVPELSTRRLVGQVDFVSGAPPGPGVRRLLVSPQATLEFESSTGWRIVALGSGVSIDDVRSRTGFSLSADAPGGFRPPSPDELAIMAEVDPHGLRRLDFAAMPIDELDRVSRYETDALPEPRRPGKQAVQRH